jgi:hypothetical protein
MFPLAGTREPVSLTAFRVRAQVRSFGICRGQSDTGAGSLRILRFPLPILIPPTAPHLSSGAGTIGQLVADVPSGLSLTPPKETKLAYYLLAPQKPTVAQLVKKFHRNLCSQDPAAGLYFEPV